MALDSELLDKFERDWNDALAHYEARTTASRMGNIQYNPSSRTFSPQEQDPKVAMGIQNELFGPLQSKWGLLSEGGGSRSRSSGSGSPQSQRFFQTRDGVFAVDPLTMESEKIVDVPRTQTGVTSTPESRREMAVFQSALRRIEGARRAQMSAETKSERAAAEAEILAAQSAFDALQSTTAAAPGFQVDPESIPYGNPVTTAPPPPDTMQSFMGDPMGAMPQDPPPAPLPAGPSGKRAIRVLEILREGQ